MERYADRATHVWVTDDDVIVAPGALEHLLSAMGHEGAELACPMITTSEGRIGWFPGLLEASPFDALRKYKVTAPEQYLAQFGPQPVRFSWATGISLLVTREALEELGLHRTDYLIRGEDLDFSLRITARKIGIFVPEARVAHHPPVVPQTPETRAADRRKDTIMLQNIAYISLHLPYGHPIRRSLPGNLWRHGQHWGLSALPEGLKAYWRGGIQGHPAGANLTRPASALPQKLLVFAHTPPPHHGQSFMVQLMLEGFGRDAGEQPGKGGRKIKCYHVNSRVSEDMEDIGVVRPGKGLRLVGYCLEAIWHRFRSGVHAMYYVPAPGKRYALYRDWMVMALCRPFFKHLVLHWHASGMTEWLEQEGTRTEQWITRALLGRPSLSIPLAQASSRDAQWLHSRKVAIVPNGIPDPCPEFTREVLPGRKARTRERQQRLDGPALMEGEAPLAFHVLFIGHCTREKGLFDTLEGVALFNSRPTPIHIHLSVAGAFMTAREEQEFQERIARADLAGAVTYVGFAGGEQKKKLFLENDSLCFPTYYTAESFPLTLLEAAAYGIPSVVTRWRAIPEIQPPDYPGFVEPKAPCMIADAFERLAVADLAELLRARFLDKFSATRHVELMAEAILGLENPK